MPVVLCLTAWICRLHELRVLDPVGADARHMNPGSDQFIMQCFCIALQKCLGSPVNRKRRHRLKCRNAGNLNDMRPFLQIRKRDLRHIDCRLAVQRNHEIIIPSGLIADSSDLPKTGSRNHPRNHRLFFLQHRFKLFHGSFCSQIHRNGLHRLRAMLGQFFQQFFSSGNHPECVNVFFSVQLHHKLFSETAGSPGHKCNPFCHID